MPRRGVTGRWQPQHLGAAEEDVAGKHLDFADAGAPTGPEFRRVLLPVPAVSTGGAAFEVRYRLPDQASMDGNTVELDRERAAIW